MSNKEVFIIGSKGIPAQYGGFESFVENLTCYQKDHRLCYHVACLGKGTRQKREYEHNGARCFVVPVPNIGAAKAVWYDLKALAFTLRYIKEHQTETPAIYILACRIGPFIKYYKRKIEKLGGVLMVNPDGHEWKRAKWNRMIKKYWKYSERAMIKHADHVICDSKNIEDYIRTEYAEYHPKTRFIAYGSSIEKSSLSADNEQVQKWYQEKEVVPGNYYLVVGRFVPENNYETMIREFMKTDVEKDLVLITNVEESGFYRNLKRQTDFHKDSRIKFVGTVYDKELLRRIREDAFAYIHGHEVGGTNPSLLEALGSTQVNLLLDVGFNREVAEKGALYWTKEEGSLASLVERLEDCSEEQKHMLGNLAKERICHEYSWSHIVDLYEDVFLSGG